jgi:hypothetical protein
VSKDLLDITNELEPYRLQLIENKQQEQFKQVKHLTKEERETAIHFLQQPNLLAKTNELLVGEVLKAIFP